MEEVYILTLRPCGHAVVFPKSTALGLRELWCTACMREDGVDLYRPPQDWVQRYRRTVAETKPVKFPKRKTK